MCHINGCCRPTQGSRVQARMDKERTVSMPAFAHASRASATTPKSIYPVFRDAAGPDRDRVLREAREVIGKEDPV